MSMRIAFIGFRHGHINSLYEMARKREDVTIAASCEEDPDARKALENTSIEITHDSYSRMLDEVDCDIVACGDYYGIRGSRLLQALERGKHVIADKPLCTSLAELEQIESLARQKGCCVGCMLDLGDNGQYVTLREIISKGEIGDIVEIAFDGRHPLLYGTRPGWYFEPGKHGGTINDIAIHAIDLIPVLCGHEIETVIAARVWNARLPECPHFQDGAAFMLTMDNNGLVMGDVSYLAPDRPGYQYPLYWRFTVTGTLGVAETNAQAQGVNVWLNNNENPVEYPAAASGSENYFTDFLKDIAGNPSCERLHTKRVIESTRKTLLIQKAADERLFNMPLK